MMYTLFCSKKTPILSGKTENIGVCSYGLVDYDSRADRYVVVNPVDVVVLHAYTAVRNRIAAAEVIFGAGAGIAQAGVERVAGARIEAYNRTNRVSTGGPACLQLVADGGYADRSRGGGSAGADDKALGQLPVALGAGEYVYMLIGAVDPDQIIGVAGVALGVDPDLLGGLGVIVVGRVGRGVVAAVNRGYLLEDSGSIALCIPLGRVILDRNGLLGVNLLGFASGRVVVEQLKANRRAGLHILGEGEGAGVAGGLVIGQLEAVVRAALDRGAVLIPDCSAGNAFLYAGEADLGSQRAAGLNLIRNGHRDLNAIQTGIDVVDRVVGLSRYRAADHAGVHGADLAGAVNRGVLAGQNHRADRAGQRDAVAGAAQYGNGIRVALEQDGVVAAGNGDGIRGHAFEHDGAAGSGDLDVGDCAAVANGAALARDNERVDGRSVVHLHISRACRINSKRRDAGLLGSIQYSTLLALEDDAVRAADGIERNFIRGSGKDPVAVCDCAGQSDARIGEYGAAGQLGRCAVCVGGSCNAHNHGDELCTGQLVRRRQLGSRSTVYNALADQSGSSLLLLGGHGGGIGEAAQLIGSGLCAVVRKRTSHQHESLGTGSCSVKAAVVVCGNQTEVDGLAQILAVPCGLLAGSQTGYTVGLRCAKRAVEDNDSLGTLDRVVRHNFAVDALQKTQFNTLAQRSGSPVTVDIREIRGRRIGRCGRVSRSRGFGGGGWRRRLGGRRNGGLLQCKWERIEHQILRHVLGCTGTQRIGIAADHQLAVGEAVVHQHAEGGGAPVEGEPLRLVSVVLAVREVCLYFVVGLGQLGLAGVGQVDLNGFCAVLGGCLGRGKICTVELPLLVQKVGHTAQTAVAQTSGPVSGSVAGSCFRNGNGDHIAGNGGRRAGQTLKLHALRDDLLRCCQIGLESGAVVLAAGDRLERKRQRVCSLGGRRIIYGKSSGEQHHGGQQTAENAFCQLQNTIPFLTVAECGHSALPYYHYLYFTFLTIACQDE